MAEQLVSRAVTLYEIQAYTVNSEIDTPTLSEYLRTGLLRFGDGQCNTGLLTPKRNKCLGRCTVNGIETNVMVRALRVRNNGAS